LPASSQRRLAALGLSLDAFQDAWLKHFRDLAAFHSEHGHCRVPNTAWVRQRYPGLYTWLQRQVRQWRAGTLPDERRRRLEGLGVAFQLRERSWEARFAELLDFQKVGLVHGSSSSCAGAEHINLC
jgi:hypothetical protein